MLDINLNMLREMIDAGYINEVKHPTEDLYILNYTKKTEFERYWNPITMQCRGLIIDGYGNVIARPFPKFFNIEQVDASTIPNLPFTVSDKLDGSLGIMYFIKDLPFIATRGSFTSEQAIHANSILWTKYLHLFDNLNRNLTYLFEIVYPENRIVLDYGDVDDIFLIAVITTSNRYEWDIRVENPGFKTTKIYDGIADYRTLRDMFSDENREGFVVRFSNGYRIKMKFQEYMRLHSIVTEVNSNKIYKYLREGTSLEAILDNVPDEFYDWVMGVVGQIHAKFSEIENKCYVKALDIQKLNLSRKEIAEKLEKYENKGIVFAMLDGKNYQEMIWKQVKPEFSRPFNNNIDEEI